MQKKKITKIAKHRPHYKNHRRRSIPKSNPFNIPAEPSFQVFLLPENLTFKKFLIKHHRPILLVEYKGQEMVMKVFPLTNMKNGYLFDNERRLQGLQHPNILTVTNSGQFMQDTQNPFYDYCFTLSPLCKNNTFIEFFMYNHLTEVQLRTYFHQLFEGVSFLHSQDISHMDLKPDNLMIDDKFQLRIFDFDHAHVGTGPILTRGTANYRAPELVDGSLKDPKKCDIYSMGILLFTLANGHITPFFEEGVYANLREYFEESPEKYFEEFPKIFSMIKNKLNWSPDFCELFTRLVQTDPEKRPSLEEIKESKWYNGPILSEIELEIEMRPKFQKDFEFK